MDCSPPGSSVHGISQARILGLGGSYGKESACNAGDLGMIPGLSRSLGGGHGNPLQNSGGESRGESHGQGSLAGYSPWGSKESDRTERLGTDTL